MNECECNGGRHGVREGHRGYTDDKSPESTLIPRFDAHQYVPGDRIGYFNQGTSESTKG